jgi:hypothetical protein
VASRVAKAGDTMTGNLNFGNDGQGVQFFGAGQGGAIYKKAGTGVTIRKHSANTQPGIEQYDGTGRVDILDTNNGVRKSGDTMTGALTLPANPTSNLHAATKQYVDQIGTGRYARGGIVLVTGRYYQVAQFGQNTAVRVTFSANHADGAHLVMATVLFRTYGQAVANWQVEGNHWTGTKLFDQLALGATRSYSIWVRAAASLTVQMGVEAIEIALARSCPTGDFGETTNVGNNYGNIGL